MRTLCAGCRYLAAGVSPHRISGSAGMSPISSFGCITSRTGARFLGRCLRFRRRAGGRGKTGFGSCCFPSTRRVLICPSPVARVLEACGASPAAFLSRYVPVLVRYGPFCSGMFRFRSGMVRFTPLALSSRTLSTLRMSSACRSLPASCEFSPRPCYLWSLPAHLGPPV